MKVGIFFGGPSREREISFAGGKTAFEHLDKKLFTPVPVFVDSFGRFIKVKPELLYQKEIRDFYPAPSRQPGGYRLYAESFPELATATIPAEVGEELLPQNFTEHFDFAFLAMHGPDCEDGAIQGLLEWYRIPYSGPGLMGSAVGIDKILQNEMISLANGQQKPSVVLNHKEWQTGDRAATYERMKEAVGLPIVAKAPHQGSSIGVAIVLQDDFTAFKDAIDQCFFQQEVEAQYWGALGADGKEAWAQRLANFNEGIGFPVVLNGRFFYNPHELIEKLDAAFAGGNQTLTISSANAEDRVLLETYVRGQEFSCGCLQLDDGTAFALPPTEVIKVGEEGVFDFNAKYKPGATRKRIPVDTDFETNQRIRADIAQVFSRLGIEVCARIDGFLTPDGEILLHDPNTIPGMSPTSLIFKQMAEIGLNVTQSLTYFIRQSLRARIRTGKGTWKLRTQLESLDAAIRQNLSIELPVKFITIAATDEAYEAAQREYGAICAAGEYRPLPILLVQDEEYYYLPPPLMFKQYVEEVVEECRVGRDPFLAHTAAEGKEIAEFFASTVYLDAHRIETKSDAG